MTGQTAAESVSAAAMPVVEIHQPMRRSLPVVCASPHSGDCYPPDFLAASALEPYLLRRSEDMYVHQLFSGVTALGAPLVRAVFPRAFVDVNREPYELDPDMFDGPLPRYANISSPRVLAGLGTIARVAGNGAEIYRDKLPVAESERRISRYYRPYHAALGHLVEQTWQQFGCCILLDCHSMPSGSLPHVNGSRFSPGADFVLGDYHGITCAPAVMEAVFQVLQSAGYRVACNAPYAGGFTTRHYGKPQARVHVLQLEINRALYMNERSYERLPAFPAIASLMEEVVQAVSAVDSSELQLRQRR